MSRVAETTPFLLVCALTGKPNVDEQALKLGSKRERCSFCSASIWEFSMSLRQDDAPVEAICYLCAARNGLLPLCRAESEVHEVVSSLDRESESMNATMKRASESTHDPVLRALEQCARDDPHCWATLSAARAMGGLTPALVAELIQAQSARAKSMTEQVCELVAMTPPPPIRIDELEGAQLALMMAVGVVQRLTPREPIDPNEHATRGYASACEEILAGIRRIQREMGS